MALSRATPIDDRLIAYSRSNEHWKGIGMDLREIQRMAHRHREDLTGEHPLGDAGQLLLACLFAATWIADTFLFKYTTFLNGYVPFIARLPLATLLLILSGYLAKRGLSIVFGEKAEKPVVIRKDVFGLVRHPIYLGEILFSGFADAEPFFGCRGGLDRCDRLSAFHRKTRRKTASGPLWGRL